MTLQSMGRPENVRQCLFGPLPVLYLTILRTSSGKLSGKILVLLSLVSEKDRDTTGLCRFPVNAMLIADNLCTIVIVW